ncbi:uncharacterized protein LOC110458502 isoform X2 [Mizuhopecten yessoensis]|uniref:uncharacterized protein LOC110458502 isoform X2 n=1 Tax=Mizuhopecten yessoensis TaxID=6573 RepID=UPI000B45A92D|nr:uncharacterized protein LOC110458502 isoform X2 [Mizuhopecten yessoensis]
MAAKYPEEGNDEDLDPENQGVDQQLLTPFEVPTEANTLVLDDSASDVEENNQYLRGSQVATIYKRSWSEGSNGRIDNVSLDLKESNFAKLVLVSTNICQDVMREIIRNRNPKGPTDIDLHNTIHGSKILRDKVAQYTREGMLLFPNDGATVKYEQLDFSAMYKVARYALSEQIAPNEKWLASPKPGAKCLMSSIEKLRLFRNDCSHSASASINDADFQTKVDEVTDVILRMEMLLRIPNTYSKRVRRLTNASLSQTSMPPRVIELETKSVNLEKQIVQLKDALAKQTDMTDLFSQWKTHQQELVEVHRKLEELYKASSTDPEEPVPLLQRNINAIEDAMRETLAASQKDEEYFVETKGTETAMKKMTENNMARKKRKDEVPQLGSNPRPQVLEANTLTDRTTICT